MTDKIPRSADDDYSDAIIQERQRFLRDKTGAALEVIARYGADAKRTQGNIENLTGFAQIPLGFAGPLRVNGEHAQGDFYVPLATTEGTLVASYTRGMRVTREAGGVTVTIADDAMQRSPVFGFDDARGARAFGAWVEQNFAAIKAQAETTTKTGKLRDIEQYAAARFVYLRFNYTTGDAAGQNLSSKATWIACQWIREQYRGASPIRVFTLSGNMDTDKKASQLNMLRTRGKRVIAEVTIPADVLQRHLHVTPQQLFEARQRSNLGAWMAGSMNNGSHSANALAAIFIATGQDAGNVAESHIAAVYAEIKPNGDYYYSITIPSLIVATHGGGTGLSTQRECLEALDCFGAGKAHKFAEIVGATVLCGELSLGAAVVVGSDWVESHDRLGRNR